MQTPSITIIILRITIVIAVAEILIMALLGGISHDLSAPLEALADASILVALSTPFIYLWVIKPYVTARDEAVARVTYLAFHDPLTQLANRRLISEYLLKTIARLGRQQSHGALLLIDLNAFKPINDNYGHATGDAILIEIAIRLQATVRGEDIAGRLGGDEFVVLLGRLDSDRQLAKDMAMQVARRIQAVLAEPVQLKETFQLGASIGIRMLDQNDAGKEDIIISQADKAMYQAKKSASGVAVIFE